MMADFRISGNDPVHSLIFWRAVTCTLHLAFRDAADSLWWFLARKLVLPGEWVQAFSWIFCIGIKLHN